MTTRPDARPAITGLPPIFEPDPEPESARDHEPEDLAAIDAEFPPSEGLPF